MISQQLRVISPRKWRLRRARCVTVWTLVSIGMIGFVAVAWGQSDGSHQMVTEIWMSGEDLAVTRRIPRDRQSAQHSYDEVARSMVNIAELRYQDRDEETAEWLHQWARELTGGRIGHHPRPDSRHEESHEFGVPTMTQLDLLDGEGFQPFILGFDSAGLAIEWPISAFTDESIWAETRPTAHNSELFRDNQQAVDRRGLVLQQETNDEQSADGVAGRNETRSEAYVGTAAATHANSGELPPRLSELAVDPRENPMDNTGRQVASVPSNMRQDFAKQLHHAVPNVPTEKPTMLAVSWFAAGVACCFVLHTLLLLTPVRLTVCRPSVSPSRSTDNSSTQVTSTGEQFEPVRAAALSTRTQTATPDFSQQRDKASSMVEEFYNSNISLFEKFAQTGD